MNEMLLDKFLDIFKNNILPLTIKGVDAGHLRPGKVPGDGGCWG